MNYDDDHMDGNYPPESGPPKYVPDTYRKNNKEISNEGFDLAFELLNHEFDVNVDYDTFDRSYNIVSGTFGVFKLDEMKNLIRRAENGDRVAIEELRQIKDKVESNRSRKRIIDYASPPYTGEIKPVSWVIPEWLERGVVTLLSGRGMTGKSRLALQVAVKMAVEGETAVFGDNAPLFCTRGYGNTLFISWEDDHDEYHRRLNSIIGNDANAIEAVNKRMNYLYLDGSNPIWSPNASGSSHISTLGSRSTIWNDIDDYIDTVIVQEPDMIVIDTVAAGYLGDENARSLVRSFLSELTKWAYDRHSAILLIGHPSKSSDVSGSTDWENGVRSAWQLTKDENDHGIWLKHTKANHAAIQDKILLDHLTYPYLAKHPNEHPIVSNVKICKGYEGYTCNIAVEGRTERCSECKNHHNNIRKHGKP